MSHLKNKVKQLKSKLNEQNEIIKKLEHKKCELEQKLTNSEEFEQRLVNYLIIAANQQEALQRELDDLK
jgi:hypothetical protein